jgi:hypothetical protein
MTRRKQSEAVNKPHAWPDDEMVDQAIATATQYGRQAALASEVAQARYLLLARMKGLRARLDGRTMSCEFCNDTAQRLAQAEAEAHTLRAAIVEFAKWDKGSHGYKWSKALKQLHEIAEAKQ